MIVYKLTNKNMKTRNNFKWKIGNIYKTSGEGDLCSNGFLHAYEHPLLAVLHNPIHANFENPKLFKATTLNGKVKYDNQMKLGSNKMKLLEEMELPKISTEQRITYAILCALEIWKEKSFVDWAKKWLSGKDRSEKSARAAARAVDAAVRTVDAAYAIAVYTADAAVYAAYAIAVGRTVDAAFYAARAAARAAAAEKKIDLVKIAKKAIKRENG